MELNSEAELPGLQLRGSTAGDDAPNRTAWSGAEVPDLPFDIANPEIAGRYGLAQPEEAQSGIVVARSAEALGSMTRRPRARPAARPAPEPHEPPQRSMLFGSLFRFPFFSQTP
jgi:hypothetical protein